MKKLAAILCLSALATGAFAQGLVNFGNTSLTLVSSRGAVIPDGAPGAYYFALLTAPTGTTDPTAFTFSGAYATNLTTAGIIFGGINVAIPGWAAGEDRSFMVAGWEAAYGAIWNQGWLGGAEV